jgi:amidase
MAYLAIAQRKKAEQSSRIPEAWKVDTSAILNSPNKSILKQLTPKNGPSIWSKVLSEKEIDITTGKDAVDIVEGIKAGTWSAEEVTTAFCKRAAVAHQLVSFDSAAQWERANNMTDELFDGDFLRGSYPAR